MKQKTLLDTQTCSEELEVLDLELKEPQIISYSRTSGGKGKKVEISHHLKKENVANTLKEPSGNQNQYLLIPTLWKITLEENLKKEKLSTILTLIKKTILSQTFICLKTEKPITEAIIVWKKLEQNSLKGESLNLQMEDTRLMSDTQRYKQMGNAVTVNVIQAIAERLL